MLFDDDDDASGIYTYSYGISILSARERGEQHCFERSFIGILYRLVSILVMVVVVVVVVVIM